MVSDKVVTSYYNFFNKNLMEVDKVISKGEVVRTFMRFLGAKGATMNNNVKVIPILQPRGASIESKGTHQPGKVEGM